MAALSRLIASGQYATQFYGPILLSVARNGTNRVANFASEKALRAAVATKDYIAENAVPGADATKGFLDKVMSPLIIYVSNQLVYIAIGLGCVVLGYFVGIPLLGAIAVVFLRSVGFASSGVVKGELTIVKSQTEDPKD